MAHRAVPRVILLPLRSARFATLARRLSLGASVTLQPEFSTICYTVVEILHVVHNARTKIWWDMITQITHSYRMTESSSTSTTHSAAHFKFKFTQRRSRCASANLSA